MFALQHKKKCNYGEKNFTSIFSIFCQPKCLSIELSKIVGNTSDGVLDIDTTVFSGVHVVERYFAKLITIQCNSAVVLSWQNVVFFGKNVLRISFVLHIVCRVDSVIVADCTARLHCLGW